MRRSRHPPRDPVRRLRYFADLFNRGGISESDYAAEVAKAVGEDMARQQMKEVFRSIDLKHGSKKKPIVQGGLPETNKRRH